MSGFFYTPNDIAEAKAHAISVSAGSEDGPYKRLMDVISPSVIEFMMTETNRGTDIIDVMDGMSHAAGWLLAQAVGWTKVNGVSESIVMMALAAALQGAGNHAMRCVNSPGTEGDRSKLFTGTPMGDA